MLFILATSSYHIYMKNVNALVMSALCNRSLFEIAIKKYDKSYICMI